MTDNSLAKYLLLMRRGSAYEPLVTSLAPVLRYRFNETSGTTVINYGSLGAAQNGTWTPGAGLIGQGGQRGSNEAYAFDGAASLVTVPNGSYAVFPAATYAHLVLATNGGEGNNGTFWMHGNGNNRFLHASATALSARKITSGTNPLSNTTTGLTFGAWHYIFATYDDAGDRKWHIYKFISGVLTEFAYSTQTAGTGTISAEANNLIIGNAAAANTTWNGSIDDWQLYNYLLTSQQMTDVGRAAGL